MISKKLLSTVYSIDILTIATIRLQGNNSIVWRDNIEGLRPIGASIHQINIYELAHRCKEWAHNYGYMLQSYPYNTLWRVDLLRSTDTNEMFKKGTEPEAVFAACEWILQQKDKS